MIINSHKEHRPKFAVTENQFSVGLTALKPTIRGIEPPEFAGKETQMAGKCEMGSIQHAETVALTVA
jgi:hypothetical protein